MHNVRYIRKAVKSALALCNYARLTVHASCHLRTCESGKIPSTRTSMAHIHIRHTEKVSKRNIKPACYPRSIKNLPYKKSRRVRAPIWKHTGA